VFGDAEARTAGRVRERWEEIKRDDEGREGVFHHVPATLPSLLHARKVQQRAAAVGFDFTDARHALTDVDNELGELRAELQGSEPPRPETPPDERQAAELGDLLFAVVNVSRKLNVDPELELRRATERFRARVEQAERLAAGRGENWAELGVEAQDRYFDLAKESE
jgi:uncharacterized protein YabN with tetrapyrrole methylase and pyrophosphatase domain